MRVDRFGAGLRLARCAFLLLLAVPAGAQGRAVSKQMQLAIDMYRKGDDLGAMDRFMEVLVKGDPSERTMANEYLNRITHRMANGAQIEPAPPTAAEAEPPARDREREPERDVRTRAPVETVPPEPAVKAEGAGAPPSDLPPATPSDREEAPPARSQGGPSDDRKVMKEEIDGKIRSRTRDVLGKLRRWEEVQVRMANSRLPRAIGIKASFLFDEGMRYKKAAGKVLEALSELVFTLGATQVVIMPEGALLNDAKIADMRRTMAISASLMKSGVAPARLRVNLLSSQVDVPRDLHDYRGILILFQYNQPLNLSTENDMESEGGPPASLGVSPATLDPREGEGVIVELSVMEPPAGLMSWKFQLLGPGAKPEDDMGVLQEVKGAAPVFHQIFWNGRKRYFGDPLPGGRYECVLTATDMRNHTTRQRAWVEMKGPAAAATAGAAPVVARGEAKAAGRTPPASLEDERPIKGEESSLDAPPPAVAKKAKGKGTGLTAKGTKSRKGKAPRVKRMPVAAKSVPADEPPASGAEQAAADPASSGAAANPPPMGKEIVKPAPAKEEESSPRAGAVNYQVLFQRGTTNITKEGEGILARVADTMHYYPLDNINLVGYAYNAEPEAAKLAGKRAELVSKLLVERHGMKADRIRTDTKVVDIEAVKVEIYIVEGAQ